MSVPAPEGHPGLLRHHWVLLSLAVITVVSGTIGYAEEYPRAGLADWVFHAARLPFLSFEPAIGESLPATLNFSRFAGFAVALYAAALILVAVFRERHRVWRARRATGHVVVIGAGPESAPLALAYLRQANPRTVVVLGALTEPQVLELRREGANVITAVTSQSRQQILRGAKDVIVSAESDLTAVRLARRVEEAVTSPTFQTVVLLDSRELAEQWGTNAVRALGRNSQVAIATLRRNPPRLEDRVCPPPVVIGDGDLGAEIVRRMVIGWQEIGEQFTVCCLGSDQDWVRPVRHELGARADLRCHELPLCTEVVLQQVVALVEDWPVPPTRKAQPAGPTIVVALSDPTRSFPIAVALAERLSSQNNTGLSPRVSVLVDDVGIWEGRLRDRQVRPAVVSFREELADPETLSLDRPTLLAEELLLDVSRWPSEEPGIIGQITTKPGAPSLLDLQTPDTHQVVRRIAESALRILATGNVAPGASDDMIVLSPDELIAIARRLLAEVTEQASGHDPELSVRALEFAARLPTLVARAGWILRRRPPTTNVVSSEGIQELAKLSHEGYLKTSSRTGNATRSEIADRSWEKLPLFEQESSRAQAADIPVKLAALGLTWIREQDGFTTESSVPQRLPPAASADAKRVTSFSRQEIEQLAELEHRRWAHHQRRNGRPDRTHVEPWAELTEAEKDYDRDAVRQIPRLLEAVGVRIERGRRDEQQPVQAAGKANVTGARRWP